MLSGLTDLADGYIARRFHRISNLGKILDPVADKLTQAAMLICLFTRFPHVLLLIVIMAGKELYMVVSGCLVIQKTGKVHGADWHGKIVTFLLYNKIGKKAARPISLLLTIILVAGVIILVMFGVIPQLTQTMGNLMTSISDFIPQMQNWIREFSHDNQDIMKLVDQLQFQPDQAIKWGISLLGNGVGNMMNTTMSAVGSIASGLATFFISFSFACYILFQKEKLHLQVRKVIFAFIPKQKADAILNICSLTYRTFANFLAGQCLEAVILGMMFVITLSILKMPYALLIGILIAFTALVPIFGAFIGCAVGSFLIFMVNPKQAVLFIIVFLLLQQIEGNLIYPHVVGGSVGLPSIWVLAAVTIGGNLMGIIGMLIFIPLVSVFYTIFREFVYLRLKKQHIKRVTRTDVEEYAEEEIASSFIVPNEK